MPFELPAHLWAPQRRGVEMTIDALARGKRAVLYGCTGSGKTTCATTLFQWALSSGMRCCFYLNRRLLIGQTAKRFDNFSIRYGIRAADYEDYYDFQAPVQICSADTERARVYESKQWELHDADLVVVDECHLMKSEIMRRILGEYRERGAMIVGLTATPIGLSDWYDELVISGTLKEYRECKAIVPAVVRSIEQPDLRKVKRSATGEFVMDGRKRKIYTQSIVGSVLDRWKKYNPDARPTMLYAPGKDESVWFTEQFRNMGVNWAHVDATDAVVDGIRTKLNRPLWDEIQQRFKDGDIKGISNRFKCLDDQTEILTKRGWVGMDDMTEDDVVATLDETTFKVIWNKVKRVIRQSVAPGEGMYEIKASHLDIRVTGTHTMVYKSKCARTKTWRRDEARKLYEKAGCYEIPVSGHWDAPGLPLSDHQLKVLGWFLSDGHTRGYDFNICQSTAQPDYLHESIVSCLDGAGLTYQRSTHGSMVGYKPHHVYRIKRSCNPGYHGLEPYLDKEMPLEVYGDISREQLLALIETLNYGDGCKRKNPHWTPHTLDIFTGNKTFADNLQALCVTRGIRCNICPRAGGWNFYIHPDKNVSIVRGCNEKIKCKMRKSEERQWEVVWCVETETGTIFTRRNNKVAVLGNCREGLDIPSTYHCILATPIGSLASYLQTIGRVLRYSPETPDHVLVTDHGGSYLRHGSPNADRDWAAWWTLSEGAVSEMNVSNIKDGKAPEPIRCPKCEGERTGGLKCPHCGFEHQKSKRHVIMEDGRMVEFEGDMIPPRRVKKYSDTEEKWAKMYWGFKNKKVDRTFNQLAAFFEREYGYQPPRDGSVPFMPIGGADWHRKVHAVEMGLLHSKK